MHEFIEAFSKRLQQEYPGAAAIVLKGSHARGEAKQWSDIDLDVLVSDANVEEYRTWIEPVGHRLVHISAAVESINAWLSDEEQPSPWSLGLPTIETTKLLWAADDNVRARLDKPHKAHPGMEPEIEDTMEALGKIRSALDRGDGIGVYRNANKLATLIPTMLVPISPPVSVSHSRQAISAVCAFANVPEGFVDDWLCCMGYVDARTPESTALSAKRMFHGVFAMLPVDPKVIGEDFARMFADGVLLAYLAQDGAI